METRVDAQVTQCILTGAQCSIKIGEESLVRTREEPSGTLHLDLSPSAANRDEAPEVNQDEPLTTTVEQ